MALGAGAVVILDELLRLQTRKRRAEASGDVSGPVTTTDVTGATITYTTETDNCEFTAIGVFDLDLTGATTTIGIGFLSVAGVRESEEAHLQQAIATDRGTVTQVWYGTLGTAGSKTLKLQVTLPTSMDVKATHTTLTVFFDEVV